MVILSFQNVVVITTNLRKDIENENREAQGECGAHSAFKMAVISSLIRG